jgi:hypothetical protein
VARDLQTHQPSQAWRHRGPSHESTACHSFGGPFPVAVGARTAARFTNENTPHNREQYAGAKLGPREGSRSSFHLENEHGDVDEGSSCEPGVDSRRCFCRPGRRPAPGSASGSSRGLYLEGRGRRLHARLRRPYGERRLSCHARRADHGLPSTSPAGSDRRLRGTCRKRFLPDVVPGRSLGGGHLPRGSGRRRAPRVPSGASPQAPRR